MQVETKECHIIVTEDENELEAPDGNGQLEEVIQGLNVAGLNDKMAASKLQRYCQSPSLVPVII